jgi:S1-C subfamily serine protease
MEQNYKKLKIKFFSNTLKLIVSILLLLSSLNSFGQTTYFYGKSKVQSDGFTGALYEVKIDRNKGITYVKIQQVPTRNMKRMNSVTPSFNTKIKSGSYESEYLGVMQNDGTIRRSSCSDNWGWDNVKTGESSYFITYVFNGAIPPGLTDFSLIDDGSYSGCRGYGFSNYTLNNPDNHPKTGLSEYTLKQKVDEQNDGIVGIYEPFDKSGYKLGCIKDGEIYKLVYLSYGGTYMSWWKVGDVKATLRPSATRGVFKGDWYMANKSINSDAYILFDGNTLKTIVAGEENGYLKMYPTNSSSNSFSSGTQEWSGTGFALNSGYITTNYHVVENANSIYIQGVSGSFSVKYKATVVATDKNNDLALLQIKDNRFSSFGKIPYKVKTSTSEVGENVFVLGYPLTTTMGDEIKLTTGVISSKSGFQGNVALYQTSAPVQPGNSGGPLFDGNGNLIGVINAKHQGAENVGYAIKASYLRNLVESVSSSTILPTDNLVANMDLTGQVKSIKDFVFMINCSTESDGTNYNSSVIGSNTSSSHFEFVTEKPSISNSYSNSTTINKVTLNADYTIVEITYTNRYSSGGWCSIGKDTYISVGGKKYTMTKAEGIEISPAKTNFSYSGQKLTFKLYFPSIPKDTKTFDLVENSDSEWRWYGIKLR